MPSKVKEKGVGSVKWVPVDELIPYARNARTHSEEQIAKIASSIREFGFNNPVLVDEDSTIIAGHGRVLASRKLGMDKVPVAVLGHLSDAQKKAFVIADNRIALDAGWDEELLKLELQELKEEFEFDLGLTGMEGEELEEIMRDDLGEEANNLNQATQLQPPKEYVLLVCETAEEWDAIKTALKEPKETKVRRGGYKEGSAFDGNGTNRVFKASRLLEILG